MIMYVLIYTVWFWFLNEIID